jgi:plastocyanin domain-containing protein
VDSAEVIVAITAAALIGLVLWFFFGPRGRITAAPSSSGVQEVNVRVRGGYSPDSIVVRAGAPVRLSFYRDETDSCSETVVFPDFGISRSLPAFKTTAVEFTPTQPGEFPFACGMSMLRGKLIVEPAAGAHH